MFPANNKWYTNTIKTLRLHNLKTRYHLKIKFCTDAYFYETLFLKINWNPDRAPLIKGVKNEWILHICWKHNIQCFSCVTYHFFNMSCVGWHAIATARLSQPGRYTFKFTLYTHNLSSMHIILQCLLLPHYLASTLYLEEGAE